MTQLTGSTDWMEQLGDDRVAISGLVRVAGYTPDGRSPTEVVIMEKAVAFGAYAVFFEASPTSKLNVAQAFVFISNGSADDPEFAALHKRLWSWGGVPLAYRRTPGLIQLFRCAHKPDFISPNGHLVCRPIKTLRLAAAISAEEAWWDAERLHNGTLWDDPTACKLLLSANKSAHRQLVDAVERLHEALGKSGLLNPSLRRRLLVLSLLVAYLEDRVVLPAEFFSEILPGATRFFHVLADGPALVRLLSALEERFNGHVFTLSDEDRHVLEMSTELSSFRRLVEAREDIKGQLNLWNLYSFRDLPVEIISHIYQLFVKDADSSVYTPPMLVRLMLDEALNWQRMDRLVANGELILDPACGSGIFLVEAYKRLVIHWRSKNDWAKPGVEVLRNLLDYVRGVDVERGAIELAAFSLCLALCDALEPEEIRATLQLFPKIIGSTLIEACFFEAKEKGLIAGRIGVVVGNPPFESALKTEGAQRSYDRYVKTHGALPDKQVAYLFLDESMQMVAPGGVLSMLQQYNLLYNPTSASVRRSFLSHWDVREILDFVSIRGMFSKGGANTLVVAIVAEAAVPPVDRKILHAVFRRNGRTLAEQGFDIDYYDLHWMPRWLLIEESGPEVWRSNLLGGTRTFSLVKRLKQFRTLRNYVEVKGWHVREGFAEGTKGVSTLAKHLIGQPLLPSAALTLSGIDRSQITTVPNRPVERPRTAELFTPPMLLIREHEDLPHTLWTDGYLTFKNQIVGFDGADLVDLEGLDSWLSDQGVPLRAFAAAVSGKLFTQKATNVAESDVLMLPFPEDTSLDLSVNEQIVAEDVVMHYRDFVRQGNKSALAQTDGLCALPPFTAVFCSQINGIYRHNPLMALAPQRWPGVICQPFAFGEGTVDWSGAEELRGKLDGLLHQQRGSSLAITRIARIYDGRFIFLLKPDRLRYWLRSIALRDSDETLADLRTQGF